MRSTCASFRSSILICLYLGLSLAVGVFAQTPGWPAPPHPGWILVDDMWLPPEAVRGDSLYEGPPWPSGFVPYVIDNNVSLAQRSALTRAFEDIESVCGVDFIPRSAQADYIVIRQYAAMGGAGQSPVGVSGGEQELSIGPNFLSKAGFIHELLHALGMKHEQSRSDRDAYINIHWGNIASSCGQSGTNSCSPNFETFSGGTLSPGYDFLSIMHYARNTFSGNGLDTITCKTPYGGFTSMIGTGDNLSMGDANALISVYGPTTVLPAISAINPGAVAQGLGAPTVSIFGSGFNEGSLNGARVLGTQVTVDGVSVPFGSVTFVSSTQLNVVIPATHLTVPGCRTVRVVNTFGGASPPWGLGVTPSTPDPGFIPGGEVGALLGSSVLGVGDINDDGYDDVVIGAYGSSFAAQQGAGRVSCFSGQNGAVLWSYVGVSPQMRGRSLALVDDLNGDGRKDVFDGSPGTWGISPFLGFAIVRDAVTGSILRSYLTFAINDGFGASVANAGDVDGDGSADHLVGAPNGGFARIFSGSTGNTIRTLTGSIGTDFGRAVAGGYDLTGDGVPDQAVGAPLYPGGNRGRVYVYSGATGALAMSFFGDIAGDLFGSSLALLPNPDGSNTGSLLVGAPGANSNAGRVRLYGPAPYAQIATHTGTVASTNRFGTAVNAAGDVNQDGIVDYVVGADSGSGSPGYVRLYSGKDQSLLDLSVGAAPADGYGRAVAPAGDTNGDGVPDLIVGAPISSSFGCTNAGYARVWRPIIPPGIRKPMLTEIFPGQPAGIEITNHSPIAISLEGWRLIWDDGTRQVSSPFPAGTSVASGSMVLVRESTGLVLCPCTASTFFAEAPPATQVYTLFAQDSITTGTQSFTVGLMNRDGLVVDEVRVAQTVGLFSSVGGGVGGHFRGKAPRTASTVSIERTLNTDSNSAGDWTAETVRSFGLENRSSGPRGLDPIAVSPVLINEVDPSQHLIELRNPGATSVDLRHHYLVLSPNEGHPLLLSHPFAANSVVLGGNAFAVVGLSLPAPAEMPASVPFIPAPIAFFNSEFSLGLFDAYGRLVDLVNSTSMTTMRVHNTPRVPSSWSAFTGSAKRLGTGSTAIGRLSGSPDTNSGANWVPIHVRSMGTNNAANTYGGPPGHGDALDVRLNETEPGEGFTLILNAGPGTAGYRWSFFMSAGHQIGIGPFFGLGMDALTNWIQLSNTPPWFGFLDARGSARVDFPFGTLPSGIATDNIFILQGPSGGLALRTVVIGFDT